MKIEVFSARGGFRITGDFAGPVSFRLLAGAKSADGATLRKTKSCTGKPHRNDPWFEC